MCDADTGLLGQTYMIGEDKVRTLSCSGIKTTNLRVYHRLCNLANFTS